MADYYPDVEAALPGWHTNFAAAAVTHGAAVGLSAAEITQIGDDAQTVTHAINGRVLYASKSQEMTAYKDILLYAPINTPMPSPPTAVVLAPLPINALPAIEPRTRQFAERIKADPSYTEAIGQDFGIIRPAAAPPPTKPTLKAVAETSFQVRLTFSMKSYKMIEIQCKRAGETEFTQLGFDTNPPYIDGRPPLVAGQPETRQYRIRFIVDDLPVGEWSDVVVVTATE